MTNAIKNWLNTLKHMTKCLHGILFVCHTHVKGVYPKSYIVECTEYKFKSKSTLKTMNSLKISNLSKTYDNNFKAINNVSITIENGIFGLLGPNGAGKSTLIRTIATLQKPTKGTVFFNDIDILNHPQKLKQVLGYLPQEFGVYPRFSAYQLLDHIAILKGVGNKLVRKNQIEALLHKTNLYSDRKKAVYNFSGGMKRRFGIAQALLGNPKLIIVDEPTAGLDPEERHRFNNLLSEIATSKIILLSTHIVEEVRDLCQNMAILSKGEIIKSGTPKSLIKNLNNQVWWTIISKSQLKEYQQKYKVISSRLYAGQTIVRVLSTSSPGEEFTHSEPNIEDVYFSTLLNQKVESK